MLLTRTINLKGLALSSLCILDQTNDDIFDGIEDTRLGVALPDVDTSDDVDRELVSAESDHLVSINSTSANTTSSTSTVTAYSSLAPNTSTNTNPYAYSYSYEQGLEFLTLDFIEFKNFSTWLLNPRCPLNIQGLRELRIAHSQDVAVTSRLLTRTGGSLEHLHLKPGPWDVHTFDLSLNPCLQTLRLTLEDPSLAIPWIMTLLSNLTPSNNAALTHISLEVYADLKKMPVDGWSDVSSLLTRPGDFYPLSTRSGDYSSSSSSSSLFLLGGLCALDSLQRVDIGVFAHPNSVEFGKVKKEMEHVEKVTCEWRRERVPAGGGVDSVRGIEVRVYQLGLRSRRSCVDLAPRISWFQG